MVIPWRSPEDIWMIKGRFMTSLPGPPSGAGFSVNQGWCSVVINEEVKLKTT